MEFDEFDSDWDIVIQELLPDGWQEMAYEEKAIKYRNGKMDPETLLRALLYHSGPGLPLRQTSAYARAAGWGDFSDVALHYKLCDSGDWLARLCREMAAESWRQDASGRIKILDSTVVNGVGGHTSNRIQCVFDMASISCEEFIVHNYKGDGTGDHFRQITITPGCIYLADASYTNKSGISLVCDGGADVISRCSSRFFNVFECESDDCEPVVLREFLESVTVSEPVSKRVSFKHEGRWYSGRICAVKLPDDKAEEQVQRVRETAMRKQYEASENSLFCARYLYVWTSLDEECFSAEEILEMYRWRWQIEIHFKTMKSLMGLKFLPTTKKEDAARAYLQGKLLYVMLMERLAERARSFSPWGPRRFATVFLGGDGDHETCA